MKTQKYINLNISSKKNSQTLGFSLVETIIYVSLMFVVLTILFFLIESASHTYFILKSSRDIERTAINIMDNISQSASVSTKIDTVNTKFDENNGSISLIEYSDDGNTSTTTKIYLENGSVLLTQNNNLIGPLSLSGVRVSVLKFKNMSVSSINGFKVELTIDNASSSVQFMSKNFYNSYILR